MRYTGVALHDAFDQGRKSCEIEINAQYISFDVEGSLIRFPLHSTDISAGGAGNRLIYFRHASYPEWCFYSGEHQLLKDPYLKKNEKGRASVGGVLKMKYLLISALVLAVLLLILPFIFKDMLVDKVARKVPVEWEQRLGASIFETIKEQHALIDDSLLNVEVDRLGQTIASVVKDDGFRFRFFLVNDTTVNAFALPGGYVVINSGLIMQADGVEEVLGVLGHEIAHVTERHHLRGVLSKFGIRLLLFFIFTDYELLNMLIDAGGSLQSLSYSRHLEREADEKGWEYLVRAGVDPDGMITFFKKLEQRSEEADLPKLGFLSTHPATSERVTALEEKKDRQQNFEIRKIELNFETFKERLQQTF